MSADWSDQELSACVNAYLDMAAQLAVGQKVVKTEVYRGLSQRLQRTEGSIELRMLNISSVLDGLGKQWLKGLKPASNVGAKVTPRIIGLLQSHPHYAVLPALSSVDYKLKLPALRDWLIAIARTPSITSVTYSDVMLAFDLDRFTLKHAMDFLGAESQKLGEPIITALIVSKESGRCSEGLANQFGVIDDVAERAELRRFWSASSYVANRTPALVSPLAVKAARFASVEVRPDQAAFRRKVFLACEGRCVLSGCDIEKTLDAAHLAGRSWKQGFNNASDGLLLRKDLHALYDSGLITIGDDGRVLSDASIAEHYGYLDGKVVKFAG